LGEGGNSLGIVGHQATIAGVAVLPGAGIDLATVAFIQLFAGATHRATIGKAVLLVADTGLYAVIKAEGGEATDIQTAVHTKGVITTVTAFHHAAFVRRGAAGLEARAIQFGGEYLGGQAHVIADLEIVGQIELVVVHRNIVVLATFVQALLAARVFTVLLQREVAFVVALGAFAEIGSRGGELVAVVELPLDAAVEIVELVFFDIEGAVAFASGVGEHHAHAAFGTPVHDVLQTAVQVAAGQLYAGFRLGRGAQVAEVDDAVVVQWAVDDLTGALEHLNLLQTLHGWRVVGAGVQIGAVVERRAVFEQQHLARAPGRCAAYAYS